MKINLIIRMYRIILYSVAITKKYETQNNINMKGGIWFPTRMQKAFLLRGTGHMNG